MTTDSLSAQHIEQQVKTFLQEDLGRGDLTAAIIPPTSTAKATVLSRDAMVLCGRAWFDAVFKQLDSRISITWQVAEGQHIQADTVLATVAGNAAMILTGERTALNVLQTLSATATVARDYAKAVAGTGCKVLDTRKTIPGLRHAQKYAVSCGGCYNHRIGLFDGILIKENHIMAAGSIAQAVNKARQSSHVAIEVEVESIHEFKLAAAAKADRIMLDNFSLADLKTVVDINQGNIPLEASGNINIQSIRDVAETGVDYISIGALTKHISAIDLSMRIQLEKH